MLTAVAGHFAVWPRTGVKRDYARVLGEPCECFCLHPKPNTAAPLPYDPRQMAHHPRRLLASPWIVLVTVCLALYTLLAGTVSAAPPRQSVENAEIADAAGSNLSARFPLTPEAALVRAYVAAWNAGDANAVALLFAPDAQIRQRSPWIEDIGEQAGIWDAYGTAFVVPFSALRFDHGDIVWAAGRDEVLASVAALLRDGHHAEIESLQFTADGRLEWDYRASTAAQRRIAGVGPTSGHAEATVHGGALVSLTIETDLTSALRRIREVMAASDSDVAALHLRAPAAIAASTPLPSPAPALHLGPEDADSRRLAFLAAAGAGTFLLTRLRRRPYLVAELRKLEAQCRRAAQSGQNTPPPETLARMLELRAEQSRLHRQRHSTESHLATLRSELPPEAN